MKYLISGCLIYLCVFVTILTFFVTSMIPDQINDIQQMLTYQVACLWGDEESCKLVERDIELGIKK